LLEAAGTGFQMPRHRMRIAQRPLHHVGFAPDLVQEMLNKPSAPHETAANAQLSGWGVSTDTTERNPKPILQRAR